MDLPSGVDWAPQADKSPRERAPQEPDDMYVVDRLISHASSEDDGKWLIRVRWAGFGAVGDTWEPARNLPHSLVAKYERRKKLTPGSLTQL
jgi:hypothetical protein